ncbi:MAG: riboflavin synthase subunit beta [Burkholderiales bacterium PBB5]|nr:MAG: riboflavin synthase subunit beta [Burkholderiales bacterium PBB5]
MNQTSTTFPSLRHALPPGGRIALIRASWHADIVGRGCAAIVAELGRHDIPPERIDTVTVPGAFEIPLHAQRLARAGRHAAIIACGLVVDGGIYRHEFVAQAVIDGLMRVQLDSGVPVLSMVLTPKDFHEHSTHQAFYLAHFEEKGAEAARACLGSLAAMG